MKIKPLYIYLGVFVVFVLAFIIFSGDGNETSTNPHEGMGQMPNDEIHQGMGSGNPTSSNVTENARKRMDDLQAAYEKNPNDTAKARSYADILTMAHQPDKAIDIYEKILKAGPKRTDVMLELTFLYFNKGDLNKAENYTESMLTINPNNPYAVYNLGIIAHAKGNVDKAKKQFEETIKKFPNMQVAKDAQQLLDEINKTKK